MNNAVLDCHLLYATNVCVCVVHMLDMWGTVVHVYAGVCTGRETRAGLWDSGLSLSALFALHLHLGWR